MPKNVLTPLLLLNGVYVLMLFTLGPRYGWGTMIFIGALVSMLNLIIVRVTAPRPLRGARTGAKDGGSRPHPRPPLPRGEGEPSPASGVGLGEPESPAGTTPSPGSATMRSGFFTKFEGAGEERIFEEDEFPFCFMLVLLQIWTSSWSVSCAGSRTDEPWDSRDHPEVMRPIWWTADSVNQSAPSEAATMSSTPL